METVRAAVVLVPAVLALATAACSPLDAVPLDRCGNGVVEPARGEDCDRGEADDPSCGGPGTELECRLRCGPAVAGAPTCPAGGVCGPDGVCRAPGGTFAVSADTRWTARSLLVGDTTGDGLPELVGISDQSIVALLGAADAGYATSESVPNLPVRDEPRMSDVNGDGRQDLTIPVGFGLYTIAGHPFAVLQPLFQNSFPVPSQGRVVASSIDYVIVDPSGSIPGPVPLAETLAALNVPMGSNCGSPAGCDVIVLGDIGIGLPAGRPLDRLAGTMLPWTWLAGEENQRFVTALAFVDDPMTTPDEGGVFIYRGDLTGPFPSLSPLGAVAAAGTVRGPAWFADADGDGNRDLIVLTSAFGNQAISVNWGRGNGTFDTAVYLHGGPGPQQLGTDALAWGDLTGDGKADFVDANGIRINQCVARDCDFAPALIDQRGWVEAAVGDVDGDGLLDVVGRTDGAVAVEVLRNTGSAAVWRASSFATAGAVAMLRVGDFDGNDVDDIAMVTRLPGADASDDLHVAFGRVGDGPAAPTYQGYVGSLAAMAPSTALIPGHLDDIEDLIVVADRGGTRGAAVVIGSTSQRLIAPLIPLGDNPDGINAVEGIVSLPLDGDATADVVCLINEYRTDQTRRNVVRVFTAATDGTLTERTPPEGVALVTAEFILHGARWVAIPARDGAPAYIVGVDVAGRAAVVSLSCDGGACSAGDLIDISGGQRGGEPTGLHAVDLDGDGDLDLVASFRPLAGDPEAVASHVRLWLNDGGFATPAAVATPSGTTVSDVAAIDLELDGRIELVALVRGADPSTAALHVARVDAGGAYGGFAADPGLADGVDLTSGITLVASDVDGDGLPDLVAVFGPDRTTPQNLKVMVQRERRGALAGAAP